MTTLTMNLGSIPRSATIPFVSTSIGLFFALVERDTFKAFMKTAETERATTNRALHNWWKSYFWEGLTTIFSIGLTTLISGIYTLRSLPKYSKPWYVCAAGTAFGLAHFTFGPKVGNIIQKLCDEQEEKMGKTLEWQRKWLQLHRVRMWLVDIPAVLSFAYLVFGDFS